MSHVFFIFFFFNDTATTEIYTLSLHDALPIYSAGSSHRARAAPVGGGLWWRLPDSGRHLRQGLRSCGGSCRRTRRSEEHTSELQSPCNLVCRLLLEKKKQPRRSLVVVVFLLIL